MANYTIKDGIITITGDLSADEMTFITGLVNAGMSVQTKEQEQEKPKKKKRRKTANKNKGKNRDYVESHLNEDQLKEFNEIEKTKKFQGALAHAIKQGWI